MCSRDRHLEVEAVDADDLLDLRGPVRVPATLTTDAVGERAAQRGDVAEVRADRVGEQAHLAAALLGEERGVDVGDRLLDDVRGTGP